MPSYVSPGVYTIEKDISEYTPSINTSIVGLVGFATKGPINKATLITSQNSLLRNFGDPSETIKGQALEGGLEILETTNSLYFVRAGLSTSAADASGVMSLGSCAAVIVSGATTAAQGYGVERPLTLRIQVANAAGVSQFAENGGAGKDFTIAAGTSTGTGQSQALALKSVIGGDLDADIVGVQIGDSNTTGLGLSGAVVASLAGSGVTMSVSAVSGTTYDPANGVSALHVSNPHYQNNAAYGVSGNLASAVTVYGGDYLNTGSNSVAYAIESLFPGTGYNGGTRTDGTTSGNSVTINNVGGRNFNVIINENGTAQETFKASFVGSGAFVEDVINTGATNLTSDIVKGNIVKNNADIAAASLTDFTGTMASLTAATNFSLTARTKVPTGAVPAGAEVTTVGVNVNGARFNKVLPEAAQNLTGGTNGTGTDNENSTALIGDATTEPKTGMQVLDDPVLNIGFALVPGIQTQAVQNALITLAETSQNFMALVSPPYAIGTVQQAIDWTNGKSSSTAGSRTSAINSSYAAVHWPWVKVFSTFDGKDRFYDPSIFAARQFSFTDAVADSWFAPAGFQRGRLTKPSDVEVKLNQGDRDSLYSGGNIINPIVNFPQQGITIFGQRTTQRSPLCS